MSTYSDAKSQERQIFCPDPELKLEPVKGIEQISSEVAISVRSAKEILAYQDGQESEATGESQSLSSKDEQRSIDEFS
jgi:hypothetical protein